ncbi:protein lin-54 homolog isoform X2 [Condylostylus longicornis]|nr:protein lin-54 homolog isoform X2 [Condylostylus longicornis]XP_055372507.1 protein lin-54 homolog isoform X2 [Condylostylus longicornis]
MGQNKTIPEKNAIVTSNTIKIGNQIKLPTKQISGTIAKDRVTGQYILIQPGGGSAVPVRLASNNNNTTKQVAVQVIRKSDGTIVPIKSNKQINLSNVNIAGKKILTTGGGQTVLLNKSASITGSTTTTTVMKSPASAIVSDQVQKQHIMRAVPISGDKSKYLTNSSTIVNIGNKLVVRTDSNKKSEDTVGTPSIQKLNSHKFIKLSPSTSTGSGNVQTLQLSSKSGGPVQYVRVLNAGVNKESLSPTKVFVKNQDGHMRMVTRVNQQPLLDGKTIIVKENPNKLTQEQLNQHKLITVPTLKKINESSLISASSKIITVKKEEVEQLNARLKQKSSISSASSLQPNIVQKPRILNNLGRLAGNLSVSSCSSNFSNQQKQHILYKKDQISGIVSSTNLNRPAVPNIKISPKKLVPITGSHTIIKGSESSQKLYSVLKPSSQNIQEKVVNSTTSSAPAQLPSSLPQPYSGSRTRSPSPSNDGGLRRKHCNCTKSQCLKLYCDCFANGEFCQDCNCKECFNNLEYEDERQKAIKMCLERNPAAFKPKITKARDHNDLRLHNKGCNCKRSGCLKNYCECYEAKIACSSNCKCIGCRNVEDRAGIDITSVTKNSKPFSRGVALKRPLDDIGGGGLSIHNSANALGSKAPNVIGSNNTTYNDTLSALTQTGNGPPAKQAYNFITQDVVDATIQCMIAQADECQKGEVSAKTTERMILEELGRCLVEIIDFSIKNFDN